MRLSPDIYSPPPESTGFAEKVSLRTPVRRHQDQYAWNSLSGGGVEDSRLWVLERVTDRYGVSIRGLACAKLASRFQRLSL